MNEMKVETFLLWGLFEMCVILIVFTVVHFKIEKLMRLLFRCVEFMAILYLLVFGARQYEEGYTVHQMLDNICEKNLFNFVYKIVLENGWVTIVFLSVLAVGLLCGIKHFDDKVVEESIGKRKGGVSNKQVDLMLVIRNKKSVFGFFIIYFSYFFLMYLFKDWKSACLYTTLIYISFSCLCIEVLYHESSSLKNWYLLLGGTYREFLTTKIKESAVLTFLIPVAASIKFICIGNSWIAILLIWMIWGFALLYQNFYYASFYLKMHDQMGALEAFAALLSALLLYVPVINIIFLVRRWKSGKRKWNLYVNYS